MQTVDAGGLRAASPTVERRKEGARPTSCSRPGNFTHSIVLEQDSRGQQCGYSRSRMRRLESERLRKVCTVTGGQRQSQEARHAHRSVRPQAIAVSGLTACVRNGPGPGAGGRGSLWCGPASSLPMGTLAEEQACSREGRS